MKRLPSHGFTRSARVLGVLAVAAALLTGTDSWARLVISPAAIRVNLDGRDPTGTFTLINEGEERARYRAKAVHFRISETGALVFIPPDEVSLAPWIRFNPAEFELPPMARRVVRYAVIAPRDIAEGEYWGGIEFEPLEAALSRITDEEGRALNLRVLSSALVTIFGDKGSPRYGVQVLGASIDPDKSSPTLAVHVENSGTGRVDVSGSVELVDKADRPVFEGVIPLKPILRNGKRIVELPLTAAPAPGEYTLKLRVEARQFEKPFETELTLAFRTKKP